MKFDQMLLIRALISACGKTDAGVKRIMMTTVSPLVVIVAKNARKWLVKSLLDSPENSLSCSDRTGYSEAVVKEMFLLRRSMPIQME